ADRIGRGRHTEPLPRSGVREMRALEDALERMREELTRTTISRDYLETLLNSMGDAVLVASEDGRIRTTNAAAQRLLGRAPNELEGLDFDTLIAPEHLAAFGVEKVLEAPGETVVRTGRGQTIPVAVSASPISSADPVFQGHIFVLRDITDRKRAERRIRYLARFDALTKIPNRMQFQHLLQQAIARSARQGRGLVLLYVDLDNFKDINDTFGHESGDRILETMSERLSRALPRETVVGRLAGDEFALFTEGGDDAPERHDQASSLARLVLAEVARPVHIGDQEMEVTASVGIATCPEHADNVIDLIRNADA